MNEALHAKVKSPGDVLVRVLHRDDPVAGVALQPMRIAVEPGPAVPDMLLPATPGNKVVLERDEMDLGASPGAPVNPAGDGPLDLHEGTLAEAGFAPEHPAPAPRPRWTR